MDLQNKIELDEIRAKVQDFLSLVDQVKRKLEDGGYSFPEIETTETSSLPLDKAKFVVATADEFCGGEEVDK